MNKKKILICICTLCAYMSMFTGCGAVEDATTLLPDTTSNNTSITTIDTSKVTGPELSVDGETTTQTSNSSNSEGVIVELEFDIDDIPEYYGEPYHIIDDMPDFSDLETTESFELYSELDELGRCGVAFANISQELMPTEERGNISSVKPSGWQSEKYDCVSGGYLYNRCHLIGFQLAGENANEKNLITGTRYLNIEGMLGFEDQVAEYVKDTGNHVLYRVTPYYEDDNLVASGVRMEAYSVEDDGVGICFDVYCYNVQPEIIIDYADGDSSLEIEFAMNDNPSNSPETEVPTVTTQTIATTQEVTEPEIIIDNQTNTITFILNVNTGKFHYPSCHHVDRMNESNKRVMESTVSDMKAKGYSACKTCID